MKLLKISKVKRGEGVKVETCYMQLENSLSFNLKVILFTEQCRILSNNYVNTEQCRILSNNYVNTEQCRILSNNYVNTEHCRILSNNYVGAETITEE